MINDIIKQHSRDHEFLDAGVQKNKNTISLHIYIPLIFPNVFMCILWFNIIVTVRVS